MPSNDSNTGSPIAPTKSWSSQVEHQLQLWHQLLCTYYRTPYIFFDLSFESKFFSSVEAPQIKTLIEYYTKESSLTVLDLTKEKQPSPLIVDNRALRFFCKHNRHFTAAQGVLNIYLFDTDTKSEFDTAFLTHALEQIEIIISQIHIKNALATQTEKLKYTHAKLVQTQKLNRLRSQSLEAITRDRPLKEILHILVSNVENEYPDMLCSILLLDDSGTRLLEGAAPSLPTFYNELVNGVTIGMGVGSCGTAAFTKSRVIAGDLSTHPYWANYTELARNANLQACWSEPIIGVNNDLMGTFAIYHRTPSLPSNAEIQLIEQSAYVAAIAIARAKDNKLILRQASFDSLTNLANRNLCIKTINQALANLTSSQPNLAIMFLDLDRFKEVNDTLGHDMGDLLLIDSANRLKQCVKDGDMVARLGGDEFLILITDYDDIATIKSTANEILKQLSKPFKIKHNICHISASIGITVAPNDGFDFESLMKNADQAMYRAKELGRNGYHFFTYDMREKADRHAQLISDLHTALKKKQFFLSYQPIVDLSTGRISKVEALIRWQHPVNGLIPPDDFIACAEDTGLIVDIGYWVIQEAIKQMRQWHQITPELQLNINISAIQFRNNNELSQQWIHTLKQQELGKDIVTIEITESLLFDHENDVGTLLKDLRNHGIKIAIDDFGTGYSSLSYIKKFDIDYLKIDKSFIQNITHSSEDSALCQTMIQMAKNLNITAVAEGIEEQQQWQLLKQQGCHLGQGYLFSKPCSVEQFTQLLLDEKSVTPSH